MKRTATARWQGGLRNGHGSVSTQSGVLANSPYSFSTRFEESKGTNPEELIAAAHAGCFAMALSAQLEKAGMQADSIDAKATVTLEKTDRGFEVTQSNLEVTCRIPQADHQKFEAACEEAKTNCPISRLLKAQITMAAKLATTA